MNSEAVQAPNFCKQPAAAESVSLGNNAEEAGKEMRFQIANGRLLELLIRNLRYLSLGLLSSWKLSGLAS